MEAFGGNNPRAGCAEARLAMRKVSVGCESAEIGELR
jgi:hypothetical protein